MLVLAQIYPYMPTISQSIWWNNSFKAQKNDYDPKKTFCSSGNEVTGTSLGTVPTCLQNSALRMQSLIQQTKWMPIRIWNTTCATEITHHLFNLHASLEFDPLCMHHHMYLPGSVLKCSPANNLNLRTEEETFLFRFSAFDLSIVYLPLQGKCRRVWFFSPVLSGLLQSLWKVK